MVSSVKRKDTISGFRHSARTSSRTAVGGFCGARARGTSAASALVSEVVGVRRAGMNVGGMVFARLAGCGRARHGACALSRLRRDRVSFIASCSASIHSARGEIGTCPDNGAACFVVIFWGRAGTWKMFMAPRICVWNLCCPIGGGIALVDDVSV